MTELTKNSAVTQTVALLNHYQFDLSGCTAKDLIIQWLKTYKVIWIRLAVVEALFQGRQKAISVEKILSFWSERGTPTFHFDRDFESLICDRLPQYVPGVSNSSVETPEDEEAVDEEEYYGDELGIAHPQEDLDFSSDGVPDTHQIIRDPSGETDSIEEEIAPNVQQTLPTSLDRHTKQHRAIATENGIKPSQNNGIRLNNHLCRKTNQPNYSPLIIPPLQQQKNPLDYRVAKPQPEPEQKTTDSPPSPVNPRQIEQFIPAPDSSQCYSKLKAVAQQSLDLVD